MLHLLLELEIEKMKGLDQAENCTKLEVFRVYINGNARETEVTAPKEAFLCQ